MHGASHFVPEKRVKLRKGTVNEEPNIQELLNIFSWNMFVYFFKIWFDNSINQQVHGPQRSPTINKLEQSYDYTSRFLKRRYYLMVSYDETVILCIKFEGT